MGVITKLLAAIPAMAGAVLLFQHLNEAIHPFANPIMEECKARVAGEGQNPLLAFVSFFNCFIVPIFVAFLKTKEGVFIWLNFVSVGAAFGGFSAIDSSRLGARFPLSVPALFMALYQFIGISIGMPLAWLPVYLFLGLPSTFRSASDLKISWPRVWAVTVVNISLIPIMLACLAPWKDQETFENIIKVFQWLPILLPPLCFLVPVSKTADAAKGQAAASAVHALNAGICLAAHFAVVLYTVIHPEIIQNMINLFSNHEGAAACSYFLLVDLIVFWVACVYHVLLEGGIVPAFLVLAGTPLLGLGAPLSFYYMTREGHILRLIRDEKSAQEKKKKK